MVINHLGNDAKTALDAIRRAVSSNPSSATAHYFGAQIHAWNGDLLAVTAYADRALRLSPVDPLAFVAYLALAVAALTRTNTEEKSAAQWARCAQANPGLGTFVMCQAWALALAGRMDEAKPICARALQLEPGFCGFAPLSKRDFLPRLRIKL